MADDDKTPEPVRKFSAIVAGALVLLTTVNPVADHFDWWHWDSTDLNFVLLLAGAVSAFIVLVAGQFVRDKVTPNENVALSKTDAKILEAATAPAVDEADLRALQSGTYPPHEGNSRA